MIPHSSQVLANLLGVLLVHALVGCAPENGDADDRERAGAEHAEHAGYGDVEEGGQPRALLLSPTQRSEFGIEVAAAGPGAIDSGTELLGEVRPDGDHLAHIVPRFPGIVREVRVSAGDNVKSGDVLAIIESSDSLAPYALTTLIGGVVLAKHLTPGESVERDRQAFVVADLDRVWVELAVYQKDLSRIAIGQPVRIDAAHEGPGAEGRISYLTPAVDQLTRTATARVVLANPERKFLPGMFVTANVLDAEQAGIALRRSAIQTLEGRPVVFVETPAGFSPRNVVLGREGETQVEILGGLAVGERVVVSQSFLLKAEFAKAEAEHEH